MLKQAQAAKKILLALATASAMCLALTGCSGGVSDDQVRRDVATSDIVTKGMVRSSFVNETSYELVELKIEKQAEEDINSFGIDKARRVEFSGKVRNESIESSFTGHAYYAKQGDSWTCISGAMSDSAQSIPLKGVDSIGTTQSASGNETITGFDSTLDESSGSYSSFAKQTTSIDKWFATDAIETTQSFTFNSAEGWTQSGDATVASTGTEYKLAGKKFSCTTAPGAWNNEGDVVYSITFSNVAEDGTVTADYAIDYDPAGAAGTFSGALSSVHETGTASGKMNYSAGDSSFKVELNDASKGVTFSCESATATISAGSGTVNALNVGIKTALKYGSEDKAVLHSGGMSGTSKFTEVL